MKLRISSWNVRGLHDPDKGKVIKSVARKLKPDLFCFQETKMREMSDKFVRRLGTGRRPKWVLFIDEFEPGDPPICWE